MQITIKPIHHRGEEKLAIIYPFEKSIDYVVRSIKGIKWTQTHKCWYLPLSKETFHIACSKLKELGQIDFKELKIYLEKRKQVAATIPAPINKLIAKPDLTSPAWKLGKENLAALEKFVQQLKLKAYSPSTITTYRNEFLQLLQLLKISL